MITALFLTLLIGIVAFISEISLKEGYLNVEIGRKIIQFVAGGSAAVSVLLIDDKNIFLAFGFIGIAISFILVKFNFIKSFQREKAKSWGMFYVPLSFTLLVYFFYPDYKEIIFVSMLIVGIADALAAIMGSFLAQSFFNITGDQKSIVGSVTFFFMTFCIIILFFAGIINLRMLPDIFFSLGDIILFALSVSLLLTILEALSSRGFDNFLIPIFTAILFFIFAKANNSELIGQFIIGVLLSAIVALASVKLKFLTHNGAAITFILAAFIFGLGGLKWSIPILTFFISSSVLSKVKKKENEKFDTFFEKTSKRDYLQVLANGGIGGVLVIYNQIFPNEVNYYIYLASLAAVCADTWATEIGTLHKRPTYNILNLQKIEQGISGGISIIGSLAAILGACIIALSGLAWSNIFYLNYFLLIIGAGLFGSFFDSILGATIQVQYKCQNCAKITERHIHCGEKTTQFRGFGWINNDAVNILASVSSALLIVIIKYI